MVSKKDYGAFMRELAKEARQIDRQDAAKGVNTESMPDSDEDIPEADDRRRRRNQPRGKDSKNFGTGANRADRARRWRK